MSRFVTPVAITLTVVFLLAGRLYASNPLLMPSDAPYGAPRLDRIHAADILPAVEQGVNEYKANIARIKAVEPGEATFENVVAALSLADTTLRRVRGVLSYLKMNFENDSIARVYARAVELVDAVSGARTLDSQLFVRVRTLYDRRHELGLDSLRLRMLRGCYRRYVGNGILCTPEQKRRLGEINLRLALARQAFERNVRRTGEEVVVYVQDFSLLKGLSQRVCESFTRNAARRGRSGMWAIGLTSRDFSTVMYGARDRGLREELYRKYVTRCTSGEYDNRELAAEVIGLRLEKARILGYACYRDFVLKDNMARDSATVYGFLTPFAEAVAARSRREDAEREAFAVRYTGDTTLRLKPWDLLYYLNLQQRAMNKTYGDISRCLLFDNVLEDGVFYVAERLYGITFTRRTDIPVRTADVRTYEAKDADGTPLGVLYLDCFARRGKRPGAWTGPLRSYSCGEGWETLPLASVTCSFARPGDGRPQLLGVSDVRALFHEFGHVLALLLARGPYSDAVNRFPGDMAELPSQLYEHWAWEPQVMKHYARDWQTGRPVSDEAIARLREAMKFREGVDLVARCVTAMLDLELHSIRRPIGPDDIEALEKRVGDRYGLPEYAPMFCRTAWFNHIFGSGYASQYYSYLWASALDADAFAAFTEAGDIFDAPTADRFRRHILTGIGHDDPMKQYVRFRGAEPDMEALMRRYGFAE